MQYNMLDVLNSPSNCQSHLMSSAYQVQVMSVEELRYDICSECEAHLAQKITGYRLWTFIDNTDDNYSPLCHSLPNPAHPYRDLTTAGRTTTLEIMSLAF